MARAFPPAMLAACAALALASCSGESETPAEVAEKAGPAAKTSPSPKSKAGTPPAADEADTADIAGSSGTPLEERVATLAVLNKRNSLTEDVELKPGERKRLDNVRVTLAACERTPPWERPRETGAFVQVDVRERTGPDRQFEWRRVFSGWLFRNSPGANVVEHPVYDVWVKDCAMSFPGEEEAVAPSEDEDSSDESA